MYFQKSVSFMVEKDFLYICWPFVTKVKIQYNLPFVIQA